MPTLILDEVNECCSIVAVLPRKRDQGFFIVESTGIREWTEFGVKAKQQELTLKRTLGYNVSASYLYNIGLSKEYIILLKNNGEIQLLNANLDIKDCIRTHETPDQDYQCQFKYDELNNHLFVNLKQDKIFGFQLEVVKNELHFIGSNEITAHTLYQFSSAIVDFDLSYHYNEYMCEEFQTLAVLLREASSKELFLKVLYRVNPRKLKLDKGWSVLLPNVLLNVDAANFSSNSCTIDTVPNVGFMIFTCRGYWFLTLPHGPQNFVNDYIIPNIFDQHNVFTEKITESNETEKNTTLHKLSLQKVIQDNYFEFHLISTNNLHAVVRFTKGREEEEKYIIYWKEEVRKCENINKQNDKPNDLMFCSFLNSTEYDYLRIDTEGIISLSQFNNNSSLKIIKYNQQYSVFSSMISNVMNDYTKSSVSLSQESTLSIIGQPFSDYLEYEEFQPEQYFNEPNGNTIDENIICKCNIRNTQQDAFFSVSKDLWVNWSNDKGKKFQLQTLKSGDHLVIDSRDLVGHNLNQNISVVANSNEIIIIENKTIRTRKIKMKENVRIASIFLQENISKQESVKYIWVSDLNGSIWIFDFLTGKLQDTVKLHHKVLEFCKGFSLPYPFIGPVIFTNNCLVLTKMNKFNESFDFILLAGIPFKFSSIAYNHTTNKLLTFQEDGGCGYSLVTKHLPNSCKPRPILIPLKKGNLTMKFIRLSPCSPFLICLTVNPVTKINYLELFDIHEQKFIQTINLTEKYQQAVITDLILVPYDNYENYSSAGLKLDIEKNDDIHYAERLILDQCFLISLNYEISEYDDHDNILLYTLDEELGQIIFQNGVNTGSGISCLSNFNNNYFIAAGETLELYRINYSVKWNSFIIRSISNKLHLHGLVKRIAAFDAKPESKHTITKLLLLDIFRGLRDINLSVDERQSRIKKEKVFELRYVLSSEEHPIINDIEKCEIISNFEMVEVVNDKWFILSLGANKIKLYLYKADEDEYLMTQFYLPNEVVNIFAVNEKRYEYWGNNPNPLFNTQNVLFIITTKHNGNYILRQSDGVINLSRGKRNILKQQMKYIGGDITDSDEESEGNVEDEQEDDDTDDEIKIIDNKILSEYSLEV